MMLSKSLRSVLRELVTGKKKKRFAALVYLLRRVCGAFGKPIGPLESNLAESLYNADRCKSCYAQLDLYGKPFYINLTRLSLNDAMLLVEKVDQKDSYLFEEIKAEDPVVIDVGSHIGVFPRYVLHRKQYSTVYAVEPDRDNFNLLKRNLRFFENAKFFQKGILDKKDMLEFFISKKKDWRSTLMLNKDFKDRPEFEPDEYALSYKVEVIDLDSFINELELQRLDLLKVTIPGEVEHLFLKGAFQTIRMFRPQVSLSVYKRNLAAVETFFKDVGGYVSVPSPYQPSQIRIYKPR